jgi:hypothetical protein
MTVAIAAVVVLVIVGFVVCVIIKKTKKSGKNAVENGVADTEDVKYED